MPLSGNAKYAPIPAHPTFEARPSSLPAQSRSEDDIELELAAEHVSRLAHTPPQSEEDADDAATASLFPAPRSSRSRKRQTNQTCLSPSFLLTRPLSWFRRTRPRPLPLLLCLIGAVVGIILLLGALLYRPAGVAASRRFCLPFSLERISTSTHNRWSCQGDIRQSSNGGTTRPGTYSDTGKLDDTDMSDSDATHSTVAAGAEGGSPSKAHYAHLGRLAGWLQAQKDAFLGDLKTGNGKGWVVVMGNEAGGAHFQDHLQYTRIAHVSVRMLMGRPRHHGIINRLRLPLLHSPSRTHGPSHVDSV